jgi:hypothetical protein
MVRGSKESSELGRSWNETACGRQVSQNRSRRQWQREGGLVALPRALAGHYFVTAG